MYSVDVLLVDGTNVFCYVALADDGKFLLAARKYRRPSCTEYLISLDARDTSKGNGTYIGKLRWGFKKQMLVYESYDLLHFFLNAVHENRGSDMTEISE